MNRRTPTSLRIAYCLVVIDLTLPFGLAHSGWVRLAAGGIGAASLFGSLVFLLLGIYRVFLVARVPGVLDTPSATGIASFIHLAGRALLYVGALVAVCNWIMGPLMLAFVQRRTESGIEFFVAGLYLSIAGSLGMLGLLAFEFGRLLAFERAAR